MDDVSHFLPSLLSTFGSYALIVLVLAAFAETGTLVGFLIPGDTLLFTAGTFIATGSLHVPLLLALVAVTAAAVCGDQIAYLLGRRYGRRILERPRARRHAVAAQRFFARQGGRAVVLARFVPLVRTLTPVIAGIGGMSRRRFLAFNVVGAACWALVMLGGGNVVGTLPFVARHVGLVTLGIAIVSLMPVLVPAVFSARRRRGDLGGSGAGNGPRHSAEPMLVGVDHGLDPVT